jgi:glycosyltransferase involved in cell wall biosynthesis
MRVLQVIAGAEHGGAETFFGDFALAMHARAGELPAIQQKAVLRPYAERLQRLVEAGISINALSFGSWLDFRTKHELQQIIQDFRPQIVQTWMNRATKFMPPRSATKQPYVHIGWLGGYYDLKYYQACDHVVVLTQDMYEHALRSNWPKERLHIVPPFAPDRPAAAINRAEFDTPDDAPLLLTLGRLHVKKAHDILIRAMADVPNAYLWIAGEGELRKQLTKLVEQLGLAERVKFLGWRQDREALLQTADLCVFPSRYEPFGVVTLEAWAQGCPLIVAASQGPKSVVTNGHDGLVVPVDDVAALVDAIRNVLSDTQLARRLVVNGRNTYDRQYSQEAVVKTYVELYQRLASMGSFSQAA